MARNSISSARTIRLFMILILLFVAAFYLFIKTLEPNALEFCEKAKKYEILIVPCDDFGVKGYVRIAYCVSYETIVNSLPKFKELAEEIAKSKDYIIDMECIEPLNDEISFDDLSNAVKKYFTYGDIKKKFFDKFLPGNTYLKKDVIKWINKNVFNAKFNSIATMWIRAYILIEIDNYSRIVKKPKADIYKDKVELLEYNLLKSLGDLLKIELPSRIELIDNSHIQGDAAVGTVVVYVNGEAEKSLYRKYKINGEEKRDDLASMKEVLYRRYYRLLTEGGTVSDLLIVDGGINQLEIAKETIRSLGFDNVHLAGLVKDNHHRTRGLINEKGEEIILPNDHSLLFFLTRMQDEVHRFAISYHHNLRSKSLTSSFLDEIEGIGPKRKELLLKTFGSTKKIKEAPLDELTQYIPLEIAKKIKNIN